MTVAQLKEIWNVGEVVTVYTEGSKGYEMLITGEDELELDELDDKYDSYKVGGIYKNIEYDCIEILIEK